MQKAVSCDDHLDLNVDPDMLYLEPVPFAGFFVQISIEE